MDNHLSSVKNGCHLLKLFLKSDKELGVSELSRRLELSKGAVHKLLMTLESEGFIKQNPANKQYSLGYTLLELGNCVLKNHNLVDFTKPYLVRLAETTQELVCLCIRDGNEAIYVNKIDSVHPIRFNVEAYRRFPLYATSASRAILAFQGSDFVDQALQEEILSFTPYSMKSTQEVKARLESIRKQGYELSSDMRNVGVTGIAAPIYDADGSVNASISMIGPSDRVTPSIHVFTRLVLQTTQDISLHHGYRK